MKKIRTFLACAVAAASLICTASPIFAADDITILINDREIKPETPAVIENGRTLVPLRAVSEALGCDVYWNGDTRGITLTDGDSLYFTWIGREYAFKTSAVALEGYSKLDVPPQIMNDYTMVPLRAISELFGAQVGWDGDTRTVSITYAERSVEEGLAGSYSVYETELNSMYDTYVSYVNGTAGTVNAEIDLENGGVIKLELYPDIAPETVNNFVKLANDGYYDGLIFHRVISGFMIQGGGYDTELNPKDADSITGEFMTNGCFNLISHERGVISMARTSEPNSASGQFFIMHDDGTYLDGQYAAFGKVTEGMEYVDAVAECETHKIEEMGMENVPVENQVIKTIKILN